jgi:plastocyanin
MAIANRDWGADRNLKRSGDGEMKLATKKRMWSAGMVIVASAVLTQFAGPLMQTVKAQQAPAGVAAEVKVDNFSFSPATLTVAAGTTVTWTNRDDIPHNVVSTDKVFKSKVMDTDEKFSYTFTKAGSYSYFCSIHPHMTGTVVVK